ncbi:MAG TPA: nucleoside triphosphate pyrophosphohydrolase [Bacillota bacterium]|nr:nucleoside triphosphate pyrophosphohydrolase [Bacillota bacterium]
MINNSYITYHKGMMAVNGLDPKYFEIKSLMGSRPSRVIMYLKLGKGFNEYLREGWLAFLAGVGELDGEEKKLLGTPAEEFLCGLERTVFENAYKIPVLMAFLGRGKVRSSVTLTEIGVRMLDFYQECEEQQLDFHDKGKLDWNKWGSEKFADLALRNPIRYLSQSLGKFFKYDEESQVFWLRNLDGYRNKTLAGHIRDIMKYRRIKYFQSRYGVGPDELEEAGVGRAAEEMAEDEESRESGVERVEVYQKLIRDKIPEMIAAQGKGCVVRTLAEDEYRAALDRKLREELEEYLAAGTVEELADLVEVALAIVEQKGLTEEEFARVRLEKKEKRGGFEKRLWLERVEG